MLPLHPHVLRRVLERVLGHSPGAPPRWFRPRIATFLGHIPGRALGEKECAEEDKGRIPCVHRPSRFPILFVASFSFLAAMGRCSCYCVAGRFLATKVLRITGSPAFLERKMPTGTKNRLPGRSNFPDQYELQLEEGCTSDRQDPPFKETSSSRRPQLSQLVAMKIQLFLCPRRPRIENPEARRRAGRRNRTL